MSNVSSLPTVNAPEGESHKHVRTVLTQSSVFFVGSIFTTATSYLFKVYVARILGAEQLGIYALGMTFVGFFGVFNALGLPQSAVRFVSAYMGSGQIEELRSFLFR